MDRRGEVGETGRRFRSGNGRENAKESVILERNRLTTVDSGRNRGDNGGRMERRRLELDKDHRIEVEGEPSTEKGAQEIGRRRDYNGNRGGGGSQNFEVDLTSISKTEEKRQNAEDYRPARAKQENWKSPFQNGRHTNTQIPVAKGRLCSDCRPDERVWELGSRERSVSVSGFCAGGKSLFTDRFAVWTEHCTSYFHENDGSNLSLHEENMENQGYSLLGRSDPAGSGSRTVGEASKEDDCTVGKAGVCDKPLEIQVDSKSHIPILRMELGFNGRSDVHSGREEVGIVLGSNQMEEDHSSGRNKNNQTTRITHRQDGRVTEDISSSNGEISRIEQAERRCGQGTNMDRSSEDGSRTDQRGGMVDEQTQSGEKETIWDDRSGRHSQHGCISIRWGSHFVHFWRGGSAGGYRRRRKDDSRIEGLDGGNEETSDWIGQSDSETKETKGIKGNSGGLVRKIQPHHYDLRPRNCGIESSMVEGSREGNSTIAVSLLGMESRHDESVIQPKGTGISEEGSVGVQTEDRGIGDQTIARHFGQQHDSPLHWKMELLHATTGDTPKFDRDGGRDGSGGNITTHSRETQCDSRRFVSTGSLGRLFSQKRDSRKGIWELESQSNSRPIRVGKELQMREVLRPGRPVGASGHKRRYDNELEERNTADPSTNSDAVEMPCKDRRRADRCDRDCSIVGGCRVDGKIEEHDTEIDQSRDIDISLGRRGNDEESRPLPPSWRNGYVSGHWASIGTAFVFSFLEEMRGTSNEKAIQLMNAKAETTIVEYSKGWIRFEEFWDLRETREKIKSKKEADPVLEAFLEFLIDKQLAYDTIKHAKSAAALLLGWVAGEKVGQTPMMADMMRGILKTTGKSTRLARMWEVEGMLKLFDTWGENTGLTRQQLNAKVLCLLLLLNAMRFTEMQGINMVRSHLDEEAQVWHLNTLRKGKLVRTYVLVARLKTRCYCCPFRAIQEISRRSKPFCEDNQALFRKTEDGPTLTYDELRGAVTGILEISKAPKWITPYTLKHLGISLLFKSGWSEREIEQHTGHSHNSGIARSTYNLDRNTMEAQELIISGASSDAKKRKKERKKDENEREEKVKEE